MLEFELLNTDGNARRGRLKLTHGTIETPIFMPVGTYGSVKAMSPADLNDIDARIILGNTFHLWLRPGLDTIRQFGGLHQFIGWNRLGRIPGFLAWRHAQDQRRRCQIRIPH